MFSKTENISIHKYFDNRRQSMNLLVLLNFFCFTKLSKSQLLEFKINRSDLAAVVSKVINEVSKNDINSANLISSESLLNKFIFKDFQDEILSTVFEKRKVLLELESSKKLSASTLSRKRFSVLFISTLNNFLVILKEISSQHFLLNGFYLIVLMNGEFSELQEIFRLSWKIQIYNIDIIYQNRNGSIIIKGFLPFKIGTCNDTTPVTFGEIGDEKFAMSFNNLFPDKIKNLHNCQIRVSIYNYSYPYVFVDRLPNGSHHLRGRDIKFLNTLSESINFKVNYTFIGDNEFTKVNGTFEMTSGPLITVMKDVADISVAGWILTPKAAKDLDFTSPYITDPMVFFVPPPLPFSTLEKLTFPFTTVVWFMILLSFVIGFLAIFFTLRCSKNVQDFVFGSEVTGPYLNMIVAFIGGAQDVSPRRNFASFLLMMFLIYSLVIRRLYQGSYFKLMQSNKHHKALETIDEMIERNYKFYAIYGIADLLQGVIMSRLETIKIRTKYYFILLI